MTPYGCVVRAARPRDREQNRKFIHPLSMDAAEPWYMAVAGDVTPESLFERRWALSLLDRATIGICAELR
jgi:hypothetical protein